MKLLFILSVILQALAMNSLQQAYIGSSCGSSASLAPLGLYSSIWPPVGGQTAELQMLVNVLENNLSVTEMYITEQLNTNFWNHVEDTGNLHLNIGQYILFFPLQFPSGAGTYHITLQPSNGQHLGCWQFSYVLN